ncbi:hypothetical protein [Rhodopirellula bahusiensis]
MSFRTVFLSSLALSMFAMIATPARTHAQGCPPLTPEDLFFLADLTSSASSIRSAAEAKSIDYDIKIQNVNMNLPVPTPQCYLDHIEAAEDRADAAEVLLSQSTSLINEASAKMLEVGQALSNGDNCAARNALDAGIAKAWEGLQKATSARDAFASAMDLLDEGGNCHVETVDPEPEPEPQP